MYIPLDSTTDAKQGDYQRCPLSPVEDNSEDMKELYRLRQGTCALLLKAFGPPSDEDEDLQENQPDMIDVVTHICQG